MSWQTLWRPKNPKIRLAAPWSLVSLHSLAPRNIIVIIIFICFFLSTADSIFHIPYISCSLKFFPSNTCHRSLYSTIYASSNPPSFYSKTVLICICFWFSLCFIHIIYFFHQISFLQRVISSCSSSSSCENLFSHFLEKVTKARRFPFHFLRRQISREIPD